MYGIIVLCMGLQSYVQDYSLMYRIIILCIRFQFSLMYMILVLCIGFQSYVQNSSLMYRILVSLTGFQSYVQDSSLMCRIPVLCVGFQSYVQDTRLRRKVHSLKRDRVHPQDRPHPTHLPPSALEFEPDRGVWDFWSSRITGRGLCYMEALEYQPIWSYGNPNHDKIVSKPVSDPILVI